MGVDISYRISIIKNDNKQYFNLGDVTSEVNMLLNCLELSYVKPRFSLFNVLSDEERELLVFENGESFVESKPIKAVELKHILRKLTTEIYKVEAELFAQNLNNAVLNESIGLIRHFAAFHNDLGKIEILVDFACEQDADIQFIAEYY